MNFIETNTSLSMILFVKKLNSYPFKEIILGFRQIHAFVSKLLLKNNFTVYQNAIAI